MTNTTKTCIVIPHFDHVDQFRALLPALAALNIPILIVDDFSPAAVFANLQQLVANLAPGASLIRQNENRGKGAAVITGMKAAQAQGFTHALQIDADGQHAAADVGRIIAASNAHPTHIMCGLPQFDESISRLRYYSRYLTLGFCRLETWSLEICDAMCGFRSYPLSSTVPLVNRASIGQRMTFDPEILVRAVWAGIPLGFHPVTVRYPEDGRSHFRYVRDNVEISWMHTRLIAGMISRSPLLLVRKLRQLQKLERQ